MKEELIVLGKVLQNDFEDLVNQQITGWLTNDFLMNADLQELTALEAELSAVWEINDQFALLEAWLTSGFMPGEWGMGNGIFTEQGVSFGAVNGSRQFEVINKTGDDWRSPLPIPELVSNERVTNITQRQERSPLPIPELVSHEVVTNITQKERSPLPIPESVSHEVVTNITQKERSPSPIPESVSHEVVTNITPKQERSPSPIPESVSNETVANITQKQGRSPLGFKELANFLASEPYGNGTETVNNQAAIPTPRQFYTPTPSLKSEIQTVSTPFNSQDSGDWEGIEEQNRVGKSNLIPKSIIEAEDSRFESEGVMSYPTSHQTVQNLETFTSQQISEGSLFESSFSQEQHQHNYSQANPATKYETNFLPQSPIQDVDIDLIFEAIAREINREYRRFYGC